MIVLTSLLAATLLLACTNGANETTKGIARLFGSGAAIYRVALVLRPAAAFAGGASRLGMPVSTPHVSVGAISGIGGANGRADGSVISSVLMSSFLTLPIAACVAGLVAHAFALYN